MREWWQKIFRPPVREVEQSQWEEWPKLFWPAGHRIRCSCCGKLLMTIVEDQYAYPDGHWPPMDSFQFPDGEHPKLGEPINPEVNRQILARGRELGLE